MTTISKRRKAMTSKVDHAKSYPVLDAMSLIKQTATAKFDEAVDVAVNLGIDAKKSDQTVRGSVVLPAGTGKKVRVAVFAPGDKAEAAKAAGADIVGMEDLAESIKQGKMDFDVVIAAPEAMRVVEQIASLVRMRRGYLTQFRVMLERHLAEIAAEEDLPDPDPRAITGEDLSAAPPDGSGHPRSGALFRG